MTRNLFLSVLSLLLIQDISIAFATLDAFPIAHQDDIFKRDGIYAKESKNISALFEPIFDEPMIASNLTALLLPSTLQDPFTNQLLKTYKEIPHHATQGDNPHSFRPQMVFPPIESDEPITPINYSYASTFLPTDYAKPNETIFDDNIDTCKYLVLFHLKETRDSSGKTTNVTTFYENTLPKDFVFKTNGNASASDFDKEIFGLDQSTEGHPALLDEGIHIVKQLSGQISGADLSSSPNTTLGKELAKTALVFNKTAFPFSVPDPDVNIDTASVTASKYIKAIQSAIYQDTINVTSSQTSLLSSARCFHSSSTMKSREDFLSAEEQIFNSDTANSSLPFVSHGSNENYDCLGQSRIDIRASFGSTQPSSDEIRHLLVKDVFTTSGNGTFYPLQEGDHNFTLPSEVLPTYGDGKVVASQASFYRSYAAGFVISSRVNATMYDRYVDLSHVVGTANGTDSATIHGNRFAVRYYSVLAVVNNCTDS